MTNDSKINKNLLTKKYENRFKIKNSNFFDKDKTMKLTSYQELIVNYHK